MAKGQEKSDDLVVPQGRRKPIPTAEMRGGKGVTASEEVEQLELFRGTADNPRGFAPSHPVGRPAGRRRAMPKPRATKGPHPSAMMTMEAVANEFNLIEAFRKVASNRGAPGPDRQEISEVREHLWDLVQSLRLELLRGSYRPGKIRRVWIPKPGGRRGLGIPNVVDRLVQQAVHQVLGPHFESGFHKSSHGFRPGRSCHTAITEASQHLEKGCIWVVDLDLETFFDRVHHERLLARLEQHGVKDHRILRLIRQMLKAKVVMPDGVVVGVEEGTPQGGPLSPLLSNVVLDELDQELTRRGHRFVRYADDCNIYVRSERAGHRVMASVTRFIERRLRLKVNPGKSAVAKPALRHFVGFSLQRSQDGRAKVRLSQRTLKGLRRRLVELTPRNWGGSLEACIQRLNEYLAGWIGFFHVVDRAEVFGLGVIDAHIRRRLRAIVFRQKKRRRHMVRWLRQRRVPAYLAKRDVYGRHRSLWALSITRSAHKAMSSYWFDRQGLHRLKRLWSGRNAASPQIIASCQLRLDLS